MFDFHTHSIFSDGELLPSEIIRRMSVMGNRGVAITDHVDFSNIEAILSSLGLLKEEAESYEIPFLVGVEITHVPPDRIDRLVGIARKKGAEIILVHGETLSEPVKEGTNRVAVSNPDVDILCHPGLISPEEAEIAKENGVYLEISSRKGHCLANGHVARISMETGVDMLINTDSHSPSDFICREIAVEILKGSGLEEEFARRIVDKNPEKLLSKIERR